jgi:hypothetical protein
VRPGYRWVNVTTKSRGENKRQHYVFFDGDNRARSAICLRKVETYELPSEEWGVVPQCEKCRKRASLRGLVDHHLRQIFQEKSK